MKVALRDDDACYFTQPETLEAVYHDIWDRVPVCFATVPFAIGYERKGIPRQHWHTGEMFPLERNSGIVSLLKSAIARRHATVALHGYTHQDYPGGYEFEAAPDLDHRVQHGREYLARTLDTGISIFVPPHNALSKHGLNAVSAAGLNLLGSFLSFHPSRRAWDRLTPRNFWRVRRFRAETGRRKTDRFVYPHVLRYQRHAEFGCHSLVPATTLQHLLSGFEEARRFGGHFCIATHYWEVDERMKDILLRFLDHAARYPDVKFVPAETLFTA